MRSIYAFVLMNESSGFVARSLARFSSLTMMEDGVFGCASAADGSVAPFASEWLRRESAALILSAGVIVARKVWERRVPPGRPLLTSFLSLRWLG